MVLKSWPAFLQQSEQSGRAACEHFDARAVQRSPQTALKNITEQVSSPAVLTAPFPSTSGAPTTTGPPSQSGKTVLSFCQYSEASPETAGIIVLATTSISALETIAVHVEWAPRVLSLRINQQQREAESFIFG